MTMFWTSFSTNYSQTS